MVRHIDYLVERMELIVWRLVLTSMGHCSTGN